MRLSLITPHKDQPALLERCVARVRALDGVDEHIVCDGVSRESVVPMLSREAAARGDRFRFRSEKDGGLYEAVNAGVRMSTGDIVGYINCDDALMPFAPSLVRAAFRDPAVDIVVGDALLVEGNRLVLMVYPHGVLIPWALAGGCHLSQPAVFFRRSLFDRLAGFDESLRLLSDHDFYLRAARAGARFAKVWEVLALAQMSEGQLMSRFAELATAESKRIAERYGVKASWAPGPASIVFRGLMRIGLAGLLAPVVPWRDTRASHVFAAGKPADVMRAFLSSSRARVYLAGTAELERLFAATP